MLHPVSVMIVNIEPNIGDPLVDMYSTRIVSDYSDTVYKIIYLYKS